MASETASFGGLSLVKKDGTHSQRFPQTPANSEWTATGSRNSA